MRNRKRYLVHDEGSARMPGDIVKIEECRPLSKCKHFTIVEVLKEAERFTHPVTQEVVTRASQL
jgi:small subunit ribosomal protein S17